MSPWSVWSVWSLCVLLSVLPLQVVSQDGFDLSDALGEDDSTAPTPPPKPAVPAGGAGAELDLSDFFDTTTTKAPPKVAPKATKAPAKPKAKPDEGESHLFPTVRPDLLPSTKLPTRRLSDGDGFSLADALDPNNDIGGKDRNKGHGGGFSDSDLAEVGKDDTYKPDKGKGGRPGGSGQIDQSDDNNDTMAEAGTIAGIVSAVAMALVGAVSSYISYQKKKLCFSIQQSLNTDMVKAENPETVVATEPQVQQTLLESRTPPPSEENVV